MQKIMNKCRGSAFCFGYLATNQFEEVHDASMRPTLLSYLSFIAK